VTPGNGDEVTVFHGVINQDTSKAEQPIWESCFKRETKGTTWRFNSFVDTAFVSPFVLGIFFAKLSINELYFLFAAFRSAMQMAFIAQLSGQKEKSKQSETKLQSNRLRHPEKLTSSSSWRPILVSDA